jgi:DNA gyrase subunit A
MQLKRPDLSQIDPEVCAYIEALETELERLRAPSKRSARPVQLQEQEDEAIVEDAESLEPAEPPTTINMISATASGIAKRTYRHHYHRQRRGGMGVFDIETPNDEPPAILTSAEAGQTLLALTRMGRAYRLPASAIVETPVRGRGVSCVTKLNLPPDELLVAIIPEQAQGYLALVSQSGMVRLLRHHVFGEYMKPGAALYDLRSFGPLAAACWTTGDNDLFIATQQGRAIRFSEKLVPPQGGLGIRLTENDLVVGIAAVYPESGVLLLSADGRGTVRLMQGFAANKAPGSGGKAAITTERLVSVLNVDERQDVFILTRLSKMIRFRLEEIPPKDGLVQGVVCISLRADEPVAALAT